MNPNSPFIDWLRSLNEQSLWDAAKIIYVVAFMLYVGFAIVVISQVKQMANTVAGGFEKPLVLLSWIHLAVSMLALVWAFVVL